MILTKETIEKYGYDPDGLGPKSQKPIMVLCLKCSKPYTTTRKAYRIGASCKPCRAPSGLGLAASADTLAVPDRIVHRAVLRQETFDRFGYYPEELSPASHEPIVWRCPGCKLPVESREKNLTTVDPLCGPCSSQNAVARHNALSAASGFAPNGFPLGIDKDKARETQRKWRAQWRKTPLGMLENRLRVALKRVGRGYSTTNLPYGAKEFAAHIQRRLEARDWRCPFPTPDGGVCDADLHDGYDVDHRIPLSSAVTEEEMLKLFALANLDVLCPDCNQFVKRHHHIDY